MTRFFPTILAHRERCPPFRNPVLSNATHHPGLAGIVKKRNCLIRSRISRKSIEVQPILPPEIRLSVVPVAVPALGGRGAVLLAAGPTGAVKK